MRIKFKKITIVYLFLFFPIFAQSRESASVDIRIKVIKNISADILSNSSDHQRITELADSLTHFNPSGRNVLIKYSQIESPRQKPNKIIRSAKIVNYPYIQIKNRYNSSLARLNINEELNLNNLGKSEYLKLFYSKSTFKSSTNNQHIVTIVY